MDLQEEIRVKYGGLARERALSWRGEGVEDRAQEAFLALVLAARRYGPGLLEAPWLARTVIDSHLRRLAYRQHLVKTPVQWQQIRRRARQEASNLTQDLGHKPTLGEVAERIGIMPARLAHILAVGTPVHEVKDLYAPEPDEPQDFGPLYQAMDMLAPDEREVIHLRFWDGLSLVVIARRLRWGFRRTKQVEKEAMDHLRQRLA